MAIYKLDRERRQEKVSRLRGTHGSNASSTVGSPLLSGFPATLDVPPAVARPASPAAAVEGSSSRTSVDLRPPPSSQPSPLLKKPSMVLEDLDEEPATESALRPSRNYVPPPSPRSALAPPPSPRHTLPLPSPRAPQSPPIVIEPVPALRRQGSQVSFTTDLSDAGLSIDASARDRPVTSRWAARAPPYYVSADAVGGTVGGGGGNDTTEGSSDSDVDFRCVHDMLSGIFRTADLCVVGLSACVNVYGAS